MEKSEQISRLEGLISRLRESDLDEEESRVLDQQILHCERILGDDTVEPEDNSMNGSYCLVDESAAEQGKDADDMDVFDRIQDTAAVLSLHNSALKTTHDRMLKRITDSHERCNRLQNDRRKAVEAISPEGLVCSNMAYLKYRVRLLELELEDLASGDTSSLSMRSPASKKGIKQFKKEWGVAEMMLSALQTELLGEAAGISAAARLKMLHAVPSSLPTTQIINQQATVAPSDPPPPYSSPTATKSHHLKRQRVSKPQMHQSALTGTDPEGAWFESSLHKKASPDMLNVRIPRRQSSRPKIASLDQLLSRSASA